MGVGQHDAGNYVVIDHGCGLRTWYTHLSIIDVSEGNLLLAGDSIGKTSENITTGEYQFYLFCTVENTVIDPNLLFAKNQTN